MLQKLTVPVQMGFFGECQVVNNELPVSETHHTGPAHFHHDTQ